MGKLRKDPRSMQGGQGSSRFSGRALWEYLTAYVIYKGFFPVLPTTAVRLSPANNGHYPK